MKSKIGRWIGFVLVMLIVVGALLYTAKDSIRHRPKENIEGYTQWDEELVNSIGELGVQDGGRVKPLSTWAGFQLLGINGTRTVRILADGEKVKLSPEEWVLDALFRPQLAHQMEIFQVNNADVLEMIGYEAEGKKKKRDRYSFAELEKYLPRVDELRKELDTRIQSGFELKAEEKQFQELAIKLRRYLALTSHLQPVREPMPEGMGASYVQDGMDASRFSEWMRIWPDVRTALTEEYRREGQKFTEDTKKLLHELDVRMRLSIYSDLAFMAPADPEQKAWSKRELWLQDYSEEKQPYLADQADYLRRMEDLALAYSQGGEAQLKTALAEYQAVMATRMQARDEGQKLASEVTYYRVDYFYKALYFFVPGFLIVALGWLAPRTVWSKGCNLIGWICAGAGLILMSAGIGHRCYLMERAPIGNLYDTIPFIAASAILVLLIAEYTTKRAVALGLSLFLAIVGVLLSIVFETGEGKDHMDPLVAVLRSNFWLIIHVITITIGYAGGLVTAGLSHIYIFARVFGIDEGDKSFRRVLTRMVYGFVCFTLFFSLVGTVLGGIWANDSWGRFWGWDPKENGALIIVLWNLVILHARLSGHIREWGLHACSVIGAALVAFSWFHVNFLEVGLHNYGFSGADALVAIKVFYAIEVLVVLVAVVGAIIELDQKRVKKYQKEALAKQGAE